MMYQQGQQLGLTSTHKFTLVAGVILPAIAITVEATTKVCAQMFFDPVPSSGHLLLVLLAPLAQLQVWFALRRGDPRRLALAGVANAAVIGISLFYSIIYLPLIPIAALTLLVVLGFLPLAPYFSLVAALIMRRQLRRVAGGTPYKSFPIKTKGFFAILVLTLAFIGLIELPAILTRVGLQMASSTTAQTRADGIRFLREYGNRDYMLRSCYDQRNRTFDLVGFLLSRGNSLRIPEAREIYYRVTGQTFDTSPRPQNVNGRVIRENEFAFQENPDGTRTPGILKGLSLSRSSINGTVDADGGVGKLVWTLGFQNTSNSGRQREVRAEIQLPPGAVVSDVSHWYAGEEHKPEFFSRSVIDSPGSMHDHKDLRVLVTTSGRDRVMVQSFPVPLLRDEITIQLGITVPLVLQEKDQARLVLPHFVNRNFYIPTSTRHWIQVGSNHPLSSDYGLELHTNPNGSNPDYLMWGEFSDTELMRPGSALRLSRTNGDYSIWSRNSFELDGSIVTQSVVERRPAHLRRLVIVVDTSASMAQWVPQIKAALGSLPRDLDVQLVLADAQWLYETEGVNTVASGLDGVAARLSGVRFQGGADNAPALGKAWDLAVDTPGNNAIVWIHNPQPTLLESVEPLLSRYEARYYGPSLYSVEPSIGPDAIERKLDGINEVKSVVRVSTLRQDLDRLFLELSGRVPTLEFERSVPKVKRPAVAGVETSDHLARLWANDEVARILSARDDSLKPAATLLASRYHLVTPTSAAVIQDSVEQLNSTDLDPVESPVFVLEGDTDFASLLLFAFIFFAWLIYRKTRGPSTSAYPI
jgi:hypothetical protein